MRSRVFTYRSKLAPEPLGRALDEALHAGGVGHRVLEVEPDSSYLVMTPYDRQVYETDTWKEWITAYPDAIEGEAFLRAAPLGCIRVYFRTTSAAGPSFGFPLTSVAVSAIDDNRIGMIRDVLLNIDDVAAIEDAPPRKNRLNGRWVQTSANGSIVAEVSAGTRNNLTPPSNRPMIFIGHGGASSEWRNLEHYLKTLDVEPMAFESLSRAGLTVTSVLDEALKQAQFAFIVFTAEDETADGKKRARQNVVHEAGLFQARLGFDRAIVLREEGVEEFSNLFGVQVLEFRRGHIAEVYKDILDLLRLAFPDIQFRR